MGIDSASLDAIEKNYINDHRRLIAMIDLWHSSVDLKPSYEAVVKALQSENVTVTATGDNHFVLKYICLSVAMLAATYPVYMLKIMTLCHGVRGVFKFLRFVIA